MSVSVHHKARLTVLFSWLRPGAQATSCLFLSLWLGLLLAVPGAEATQNKAPKPGKTTKKAVPARTGAAKAAKPLRPEGLQDGQAEAKLIEIYRLVGQSRSRDALQKAEQLVKTYPNFNLAQLVYGDLLAAQTRPVRTLGDVPDTTAKAAAGALAELREESALRLKALKDRPPPGTVPTQFVALSSRNKHAIAVDAAKSRLYLFENSATGVRLVSDYYISVGRLGIEKALEGDLRTPLGVYFITSNLDPNSLKDFYGAGALPINYPNPLDVKRGKTGSGIWLHGTPPNQFSRPPRATDGCVVLANPDLEKLLATVEVRTTPVVIAPSLQWITPLSAQADRKAFEETLQKWLAAKSSGDMPRILDHYAPDFNANGKSLNDWTQTLRTEVAKAAGRSLELKDVSLLRWKDSSEIMVVTFGELVSGAKTGSTKRQYWVRHSNKWKIFFEGVIG